MIRILEVCTNAASRAREVKGVVSEYAEINASPVPKRVAIAAAGERLEKMTIEFSRVLRAPIFRG
jgi:hypothetical protein